MNTKPSYIHLQCGLCPRVGDTRYKFDLSHGKTIHVCGSCNNRFIKLRKELRRGETAYYKHTAERAIANVFCLMIARDGNYAGGTHALEMFYLLRDEFDIPERFAVTNES
jgi:hypothetical protein